MAAQSNYQLLINKLDQFIRKYYINKVIRGALYSVGFVLLLFLVVDLLIYYNDFGTSTRTTLFFSFLGLSLAALTYWVFLPLAKYFRLGQQISHEQAASIIGDHFVDVKDKLLNILQLKRQSDGVAGNGLILAGIDQKSEEIKLVPFKSAINLSHNRKYLRYALPPLLLLLVLLFAAPSLITDGTERLVKYGVEFVKPEPFKFVLEEENPSVVQYGDYPLQVKIEGDQLPNEVFIALDNVQYRLKKEANNLFSYKFSNVQKAVDFKLFATEVTSKKYKLEVLKKPNVLGFEVKLNFPKYTGRKNETLNSIGDLVVPVGTTIDWVFNAENTDDIQIAFSREEDQTPAKRFSDDLFTYKKKAMQDDVYKLYMSNEALPNADSISYGLTVIPDLYPEITVEKFQDSLDAKLVYFVGEASDDYGMNTLSFNYRITKAGGSQEEDLNTQLISAPVNKQTSYDHIFDLNELELKPGDEVSYYFEVFDNDAVNGSKSSRTNVMIYAMPTVEEFEAMAEANDEQIMDNLKKALEDSKKVQDEMKKLREKLLQEKELDWQDRKELEKLLDKQKELEKQIEKAQQAFQENMENQPEFETPDEQTQDKQEQLEEMFEDVMSPEMKELMQKMEELLQEMDKEEAMQMLEQMEANDEEMEMDLERLEELYKQLELEQELNKAMEKLDELAEKQEKLAEETEKKANEDQKEGEQKDGEQDKKEGEQKSDEQKEGEQKEGEQKEGEQKEGEQKEGEKQENKEGEKQDDNKDGEQKEGEQKSEEKKEETSKQEDLIKKQEEINKEFEKVQEQLEKAKEKNEQLENKQEMGDKQEQMEDINRDMKESQQQLQKQQNQKAAQSQKKAAQKMKQMSQQMSQQMQSGQQQQMQEDMEALRQLLENLVGLSFDQEDLIDNLEASEINTPRYVELVQDQFKIKDDFKLVEDSLRALSKRVFQIESFITEKVTEIKSNLGESLEDLEERRKYQAADHQQRTMKNVNDLALMLSETMNQMQQQMAAMMSGSPKSGKPNQQGQGEPSDQISQGQQQLNKQMQQQGKGGEGGEPGVSSEEFAKMAARQAALRRALEAQQKKLREQGKGSKELQGIIDEMDKVEIDLVNKQLRNETFKRQQEILTRLLRHEKAERQREFDEKRKSEVAEEQEKTLPPSLEEYIKKRKAELELYKTVSPSLKPYYKNLVEEYFKKLQEEKTGN